MRQKRVTLKITVATIILFSVQWLSAAEASLVSSRFTIPKIAAAPVIDGTVDEREWHGATRIDGVTPVGGPGALDARETCFWLAWDDKNLYVAGRSELREGERLATVNRIIDTQQVVFDDSYEFGFDTMGRSQRPGDEPFCYKFFINYFNRMGLMKSIPSIGGFQYTWNPQFSRKSRITPDRRFWEFEMAMPVCELEQTRDNMVGDELRVLLGRNYKYPWDQCAVPLMKSGYMDSSGWPVATLSAGKPFVQLFDLYRISRDGKAICRIVVRNPVPEKVAVNVVTKWTGGIEKRESLNIAANGEAVYAVDQPLAADKGRVEISATCDDGTVLLDTCAGYDKDKRIPPYELKPVDQGGIPLSVTFNPLRSQLWLQGDTFDIDWLRNAKKLKWRISSTDGAAVSEGEISTRQMEMFSGLIALPDLKPGEYAVSASMLDADGKTVGTSSQKITKLDEKKEFPWFGNTLGDTERIIPPFIALTTDQDKQLTAWGRVYSLSGLGLPSAIKSQDCELLSEAVRIVVVRDGKTSVIPLNEKPEITEVRPWRIRYRGAAEGAGLRFNVRGCLEQDGTLFNDLTYEPIDGKPLRIDALRLEYPLRSSEATLIHCVGGGHNYAAKTTEFLPVGQGKVWDTLVIGKQASLMTVGNFYPQIWLGNDQRGFLWWADSDRGWIPDNGVPAHEVLRQGDQVILRNNIIGSPIELARGRTLRFSLNATPFKAFRPGWRLLTDHSMGRFSGNGFKKLGKIDGWNLLHAPSANRSEWPGIYAEYKKQADERMNTRIAWDSDLYGQGILASGVPISSYGFRTLEKNVLDYFGADWNDSLSPSQQDYYLSLLEQWVREGGLKRIYLDITMPEVMSSVLNGTAYLLPDGRIQPGFTLENMRRFYMRVFAMMTDLGCMPNGITGHSTNAYPMPVLPWLEILLDGEFNHVKDSSTFEWIDGISPARIRSMNLPSNWGLPFAWLIKLQIEKNKDEQARQMDSAKGWLRLHDNWYSASEYPYWAWGLGRPEVSYIPYWRTADIAQANNTDLRVSLWRHDEGVMALIYNDDKTKIADGVQVRLDLAKFGLGKLAVGEKLVFTILEGKPDGQPVFDGKSYISGFNLKARKWVAVGITKVQTLPQLPFTGSLALDGLDPDSLWQWGLGKPDVRQEDGLLQVDGSGLRTLVYQRPDRLLVLALNTDVAEKSLKATVDMKKAGMLPINPIQNRIGWQVLQAHNVAGDPKRGPLSFNPATGKLADATIAPKGWIAVEIRRY